MRPLALFAVIAGMSCANAADPSRSSRQILYPLIVRQQLTFVSLRYTPGNELLKVNDLFNYLSSDEVALLSRCLPTGTLEECSTGLYEEGPKAKAIVVFTAPVKHRISVKQPWQSTVVYIQDGETFRVCPKDAELSDRHMYFEPQRTEPQSTIYLIDLVDGGQSGGSACLWKKGDKRKDFMSRALPH